MGEERCLADVLREWGVSPDLVPLPAGRWRCRVAQAADTDEEVAKALLSGAPCHPSREHVAHIHEEVGEDGVAWITRPEWDKLPRPKLAFNSQWGRPGSGIVDPEALVPVRAFSEVFSHSDGDSRNLQMFHRESADEPNIPVLPKRLRWPLADALAAPPDAKPSEGSGDFPAVVLDRATRLSQRGALTCWHLDDCGELVFQTALPCSEGRCRGKLLRGPTGKPITKIFILAPRWAYDWFTQDAEQERTAQWTQMDLWHTPDEALPRYDVSLKDSGMDSLREAGEVSTGVSGDVLPVLWVALVEAGGRPLLLPPNLPHTVLTLQDCVMVEERRLSRLWLDDVHLFEERNRHTKDRPISYRYVTETLRDPSRLSAHVVQPLLRLASLDSKDWLQYRVATSLTVLGEGNGSSFIMDPSDRESVAKAAGEGDTRYSEVCVMLEEMHAQPQGVMRLHGCKLWCAYCHVNGGAPHFGPVRGSLQETVGDRRTLAAAVPSGQSAVLAAISALYDAVPAPESGAADQQLMDELF
eukprot:Hpha_TRINITY_DN33970_c0_g1::TRINITY_DN33970_c0_g1_i1::g.69497::m.69497